MGVCIPDLPNPSLDLVIIDPASIRRLCKSGLISSRREKKSYHRFEDSPYYCHSGNGLFASFDEACCCYSRTLLHLFQALSL
ncbi:hypothetical protein PGT21_016808 [Puccinia graminis f. sp. tritici]|uniref:Uncharacterized protein n=1 Tax=Puccinia graminis f. sp. tritici TaxID=56615 RepID=A0A5B0PEH4_PUCGR|nr:hypothetical protein PGT21_016808 [Puccinia graminis f. sp. tritici]